MSGQQIHYEELAQNALRSVVRTVLSRVEKSGLPGDHHFFIAFDTQGDGVVLSKRLKEQYPEEMTIVLQHQFWDLKVTQDNFEIKLSFNEIPERLVIPFSAMKVFFDPSVPYGLQFGTTEPSTEDTTPDVTIELDNKDQNNMITVSELTPVNARSEDTAKNKDLASTDGKIETADTSNEDGDTEKEQDQKSADIVSLDQFRKK